MRIIAITPPQVFQDEAHVIERLLDGGIHLVHLRLPEATTEQADALMAAIDTKWHSRITLASHYELLDYYGFGGVHLRHGFEPQKLNPTLRISRSCHKGDDLRLMTEDCHYAFISPVYDSISKPDYESAFTLDELATILRDNTLRDKLVALGGVTAERLPELKATGFKAAAMMGYLFEDISLLDKKLEMIRNFNR